MNRVVLAFPPLVESSFGRYFPSLAVLAGYLGSRGIPADQWDLNEEFALALLDQEHLRAAAEGRLTGLPPTSAEVMSAVAGRWLGAHPEVLFDAEGRHAFAADTGAAYLLSALAKPYLVDPEPEWLGDGELLGSGRTEVYRAFYERLGLGRRIPGDVRLFGISVPMGPQLIPALLLAEAVKRARPELRVVLGGPTLSLMQEEDLSVLLRTHHQVDAVIRFDGELPLVRLYEQACDGGVWDPAAVPGTSARSGESVVHAAPGPGLHPNVLPHADYDRVLLGRLAGAEIGIMQARGCYWGKCDYCDFVELYDGSPPYRGRSVKTFVAELEHQVEVHGVRHFELITESIPPAFARRFCDEVISRGLDVTWNSFAMVDRRFDAELLRLMVRAGCEYLVIGMETTNSRVLKLVHKSADRDENIRFMREAHDAGMKLRVNLIPDLPSTTLEEALEALGDVAEMADCVELFTVFPFEATRSSEIGRNPERFGLVVASEIAGTDQQAQYALNHLGSIDPAMTDHERLRVHRAFRDFSVAHGSDRMRETGTAFLDRMPEPGEPVRFGLEYLDVLPRGGELVVTHILRRERTVLPAVVAAALAPWRDGSPLTLGRLAELRGAGWAAQVMGQLVEARMLMPAAAPARPARSARVGTLHG
ncbi:radical SAM protein [Streptomyces sp. ISL-43]|uniref:B12-binding domain-containing radical SAM protein n=1 Tax=Streptomyces sp. ISL-43 TaxID=2819183 RepID=UPI001BEBA779|nr:radical SAM protein [Streptomyces sp. ISL-43]MBT2450997.1 radical SAM protein [Streptomyces sp. ISL-43]